MKQILITCVNHNSYKELKTFLSSINNAAKRAERQCHVVVLVADNSDKKETISTAYYSSILCYVYSVANNGYINSAQEAMLQYGSSKCQQADFVIVSNVDISLNETFFSQLLILKTTDIGWIVPRIYTPSRKTEENPSAIYRYSKFKLQILKCLFSVPFLLRCYEKTIRLIKCQQRQKNATSLQEKIIYAGHGSIFIFTKNIIQNIFPFNFPCFLYGEELYFAELLRKNHLNTCFYPQLEVENTYANVSTSKLKYAQRCKYNYIAIRYILNEFYT